MSALYRTYRPRSFSDVIGQDHIVTALTNALKRDQIGHAFLFAGPRGTGKTTVARLLAKSANCLNRDGAEPCQKCAICKQMDSGQSVDVIEIDAASNRGIDEIRELKDKVRYAPGQAKYRVYIIDEVHMLTKEAFNALLKTLEEPPTHAIFILATTELHKLPETIISRCQRYHFRRAPEESLVNLLRGIAKKEKHHLSDQALTLLARRAEGSYRDALTLLDNVSEHEGEMDEEAVRSLFGLPQAELVSRFRQEIATGQGLEAIKIIDEAISSGRDLTTLVQSVVEDLERDIFTAPNAPDLVKTANLLEQLLLTLARARHSSDPDALLTASIIRLTGQTALPKTEIKEEETASTPIASPPVVDLQKSSKPKEEPISVDSVSPASAPTTDTANFWDQLLQEIKSHNHALYMVARSAQLGGIGDGKIVIMVKFRFYADRLHEAKNRKIIESSASKLSGTPLVLDCQVRSDLEIPTPADENVLDAVVEVFEIDEKSA